MIPDRHALPDRTGLASASLVNGAIDAMVNGLIQLVLLSGKGSIARRDQLYGTYGPRIGRPACREPCHDPHGDRPVHPETAAAPVLANSDL